MITFIEPPLDRESWTLIRVIKISDLANGARPDRTLGRER
jgi:hypothetical protein